MSHRDTAGMSRSYAAPDGMTPQALRGFEGHDVELAEQLRRDILETCDLVMLLDGLVAVLLVWVHTWHSSSQSGLS